MVILRVAFSTSYISGLNAGNSVQDVLVAIPVLFLISFIVALPILILLKRHPGKAIMECSIQVMGRGVSAVIGLIYISFFIFQAAAELGTFHLVFTNAVIPESQEYAISIPLLIVCMYGAAKGIESVSRFGTFVFALYVLILIFNMISLLPRAQMGYLFPLFYNGPRVFLQSLNSMFNSSVQILTLAVCASFLKPGSNVRKVFSYYNVFASLLLFLYTFLAVMVMGPYTSKQVFPLFTLSELSKVGVFERLDSLEMVLWIFDTILAVTVYIFLAANMPTKFGLNKYRKVVIVLIGAAVYFLAPVISHNYLMYQSCMGSLYATAIVVTLIVIIPLIILITDIIKEKVKKNEAEN